MVEESGNGNSKEEDSSDDEEANFKKKSFPVSEPIQDALIQGITSYNMINQIGIFRTWSLRGSLILSNQCNQFLYVKGRVFAFSTSTYVGVCFHWEITQVVERSLGYKNQIIIIVYTFF
jgi:hypothetical protein